MNTINESDHDSDSEIEIDEEDEHSDLDVGSESFEDHNNDDKYFIGKDKQISSLKIIMSKN